MDDGASGDEEVSPSQILAEEGCVCTRVSTVLLNAFPRFAPAEMGDPGGWLVNDIHAIA